MATMRQAAANRQNAQKSTGPKTEEGKAQSRQNGMTHGLTTTAFVSNKYAAKFEERKAAWKSNFSPADQWQDFQLSQVVLCSIRLEQCQSADQKRRVELTKAATEPGSKWELARYLEVVRLNESLKRNPPRVALELWLTVYGRMWMLVQWQRLLLALPATATEESQWTEAETQETLDLMGVARKLRAGMASIFIKASDVREMIGEQIAKITAELANRDLEIAQLRQDHINGFQLENDASLKQIRRYEADAYRRLNHATKAIAKAKAASPAPNEVAEASEPEVAKPTPKEESPAPETPQPHVPKGNRHQRRKQEASARHEAHLARERSK